MRALQLHRLGDPAAPPRSSALAAAWRTCGQGAEAGDSFQQASAAMDTALSGDVSLGRALAHGEFQAGGQQSVGVVAGLADDLLRRPCEMGRLTTC